MGSLEQLYLSLLTSALHPTLHPHPHTRCPGGRGDKDHTPGGMEQVCACLVVASSASPTNLAPGVPEIVCRPLASTTPQWSQPLSQKAPCGWGLGIRIVFSFCLLWPFLKNEKLKKPPSDGSRKGWSRVLSPFEPRHLPPIPHLSLSFPTSQLMRKARKKGNKINLNAIDVFS